MGHTGAYTVCRFGNYLHDKNQMLADTALPYYNQTYFAYKATRSGRKEKFLRSGR